MMPKGYDRETGWDELTDPRPASRGKGEPVVDNPQVTQRIAKAAGEGRREGYAKGKRDGARESLLQVRAKLDAVYHTTDDRRDLEECLSSTLAEIDCLQKELSGE